MTNTKPGERDPITLSDLYSGKHSALDIPDVAPILNLSPWAAYQAAQRGEIPTIRIGRRIVVPVPALLRMLDGEQVDEPTALARPKR